jgi:hypothetical protein
MAAFAKTGGGSSGTVSAGRPSSQSCAEEIKPTEAQRKGNQNATKMQSKQSASGCRGLLAGAADVANS